MIGIDTNILVRYLTQDDELQSYTAVRLIEKYAQHPRSIFINEIVMCELIWVLERGYKYNKEQIVKVIRQILSTEEFVFERQNVLWFALDQYSRNKLDFSDALIGEVNKHLGCEVTCTFDHSATKVDGFRLAEEYCS